MKISRISVYAFDLPLHGTEQLSMSAGRPNVRAIEGDVTRSYGVLGYGAYQVNDGTGTLSVVTKEGGAPRTGAHVGVMGTFRAAFTLGTETSAVLKEERRTSR